MLTNTMEEGMSNLIDNFQDLLQSTTMLDYHAAPIQELVDTRGWRRFERAEDAAHAIYNFCREEILFGYNAGADDMTASQVLAERIGHCNTKTTLLMALLRSVGIPCRLHGFTIDKRLQKGAMTPFVYLMAPREILHTWAEAWVNDQWLALEGIILDTRYLHAIQAHFEQCASHQHPFLGYAVATRNLGAPKVEWTGRSTFIQREGIARELGIFNSPDDFYSQHETNLRGVKGWLYRKYFYKQLNRNISSIRNGRIPERGVKQECGR